MTVGVVQALWRYPVKSLRGESLARAQLTPDGIPGDRGYAFVDAATGIVLSAKKTQELLCARAELRDDGVVVMLDGEELQGEQAARAMSAMLGRAVQLRAADDGCPVIENQDDDGTTFTFDGPAGGFFDSSPIHVVTTSSLAALKVLAPDVSFDMRRFRPNVVVDTGDAQGTVELAWVGARITLGDVELEITKPCSRCRLTTAAQDELPFDRGVLRTVAREMENHVGVYARAVVPGWVSVGDAVSLTAP